MSTPFYIAGVDEAGRGPLVGPVTAAAVILQDRPAIRGLGDSKTLSEKRRLELEVSIKASAIAWSVAHASAREIDEFNILQATLLAMARAVKGLSVLPSEVLVDGNRSPQLVVPCKAIVKGDSLVREISAASILAKCARDRLMLQLHHRYPQYGFDRHKGYGTLQHRQAIDRYGVIVEHRRSFAPVARAVRSGVVASAEDFCR